MDDPLPFDDPTPQRPRGPLSGAERQRRYRERKRQGVTVPPRHPSPAGPPTVTLRPREMRVIANKALGMSTEAALKDAGFSPGGYMKTRLMPGGDLSIALGKLLDETGAGLKRVVAKAGDKLEARRVFNASKGRDEKGRSVTECIEVADNDAQLRAAELLIGLHERAGTIPTSAAQGVTGGSLHYHLHLDGLAQHTSEA